MGWGELGFWAAFVRRALLIMILIKLATHHTGAISPVNNDEFSTPARDRFNLLC
jgi:hypothetical protein